MNAFYEAMIEDMISQCELTETEDSDFDDAIDIMSDDEVRECDDYED